MTRGLMLRRALSTTVVAMTFVAPAAAAPPVRGQALMPGVVYSRQVAFTAHGPVVLNVVSAPRPQGLYSVRAVLSNAAVQGRARLTDMEKEVSGRTTAVGVDGDFFDARWGTPSGVFMHGGALAAGTLGGRSAAGFDAAGTLHVDRLALDGSWQGAGQYRPLALNAPPPRAVTTLYTPQWGPTTPPEDGTTEVVLAPFPATTPNTTLSAPVVQVAQGGAQAIPGNGAVLVARGRAAQTLAREAPAGSRVNVRLLLTPSWDGISEAVGGGPLLVRSGRPLFRADEAFSGIQLLSRTARGAVGQTADGRLLLVTADGDRRGYTLGVTNFELALAMMRLGAVSACGLGTGAAAGLAFDGNLLSRAGRAGEAPISDALFIEYDGVYVPAPAATVATGQTQALAYKLVRPSTVTATLTSPSGGTTTLDAGARAAGIHSFAGPAAAGRWTFAVSAVDDLGRASSASRVLTVGGASARR